MSVPILGAFGSGVRCGGARCCNPLVRNVLPEVTCMECEKPATHLCMECQIENDESGLLCDAHTKKHPHDNYDEPMEIVNSPRLGMCGYDGPAEPPY